MDVGFTNLGLHNSLDSFWVEDTDRDVLGDDLFMLAPKGSLEMLRKKHVIVIKGIITSSGRGLCRARGVGGGVRSDGHREHRQAVLFGEAEGRRDAVEGRFEGALEWLKRQLEVDSIGSFCRLNVVVVKDEVHGERADQSVSCSARQLGAFMMVPRAHNRWRN